jgi:mono/diheme cytochrome c family protein
MTANQSGGTTLANHNLRSAFLVSLMVIAVDSAMAEVDAVGKRLHDAQCISCHAQRFGGDGSPIYLRKDRIIHDEPALRQRVAMCSAQTNAGWLPEEEQHVSNYLAQRYYKFK